MRELLRKVFVDDAILKLLAFVLSIVLFLLRSDWDATASGYVRVIYTQPRDRVVTSDLIKEVKIVVRGPLSRVNRFNESDLDPIVLDLTKHAEGEMHFTEDMVRLPQGLRVASFTPAWLYIGFDPLVERTLPVQTILEGEPAEGYRLGKITSTPRTVRVSGAKSVVEGMQNVPTRPVRVSDLRSAVELSIRLAPAPKNVRTLDPPEVKVHVDVDRTLVEQTYKSVQVAVTGSSHIEDIELSPAVATVLLRGPAPALAKFKGSPELVVDAAMEESKPPGTYRKRLQVVNLPTDIAAEIRPDSVLMTTLKTPKK